jgi:hypothetical protein
MHRAAVRSLRRGRRVVTRLDIPIPAVSVCARAGVRRRRERGDEQLAVFLAHPVYAQVVEGCFEVVEDDCVTETFEDEG